MGLALSTGLTVWKKVLKFLVFTVTNVKETVVVRFISFPGENRETRENSNSVKESNSEPISSSDVSNTMAIEESISVSHQKVPEKLKLETSVSLENLVVDKDAIFKLNRDKFLREFASPRPVIELDEAALKLQKVYKGYRTRRNLADCAVVVEELWWKALEFACLNQSSVSFFDAKPQTAFSRWSRARTRAAKVGKGLSKDEKAQKLALQHWLEAIDPRHRYGHNMHFYYDVWFDSQSPQPFFYWLDVGDGKEVNLEKCPRNVLQKQCIKYLAPNERAAYEVIVENGKLIYRESGIPVNTDESSKWIFVLSTLRNLYVGQKIKGVFQHSSFLSGGATTAAGRLIVNEGVLKAIWPYSGHYLPTEENFKEFISFLEDHNVDLSDVKKYSTDEDISSFKESEVDAKVLDDLVSSTEIETDDKEITEKEFEAEPGEDHTEGDEEELEGVINEDIPPYLLGKPLSCKWATGAGPRIGCVRDYPVDLQFKALEQVNLSPRVSMEPFSWSNPIPSPRPSPKIRISPRLSQLGIPSPRVTLPPVPQVLYKAS